jgi:hypothetical protein
VVLNLAVVILSASIHVEQFLKSQKLFSVSQHSIRGYVSFVASEVSFGLDLAVATRSKVLLCQATYRLSAALVLVVEKSMFIFIHFQPPKFLLLFSCFY